MRAARVLMWMSLIAMQVVGHLNAADRDSEWEQVAKAREKDQPKTAIELLRVIEKQAFAERAWAEGARAMAQRIATEAQIEGGPAAIKLIDAELESAPDPAKPVLRALSARWLAGYFRSNQWRFMQRSQTREVPSEDIEGWDLATILNEIDARFQDSLSDEAVIKGLPVADYTMLMSEASLGDDYRPTMFDFVAHQALAFYSAEEVAVSRPVAAFEFGADSPAFGSVDEFLKWKPVTDDLSSPKFRALAIHQKLLGFHRADEDPSAFLLADLERLRWARLSAGGNGIEERFEKELRGYIKANAGNPLSAWAREDLGLLLKDLKEAHSIFKAGAEDFPKSPFGKLCANQQLRLESRNLSLATESQWTPAGEEIRVNYRNLDRVWFRIYSMKFSAGKATMNRDPLPDSEKWLPSILEGAPLVAWSNALEGEGDYKDRVSWIKVPQELPDGYHLLVASSDEGFSMRDNVVALKGIHITPMALMVDDRSNEGLVGFVVDAVTGAPLEGIQVGAWYGRENAVSKKSTRTNDEGRFQFNKLGAGGRYLLVAERGRARAVARGYHHQRQRRVREAWEQAVFFTDRSLYRPGQTVSFKGIFCRIDQENQRYQVIPEKEGIVLLRDPNGKEAGRFEVVSNQRGSFSGSFTVPEGTVLGQYRILVEGLKGGNALRVEEYKRPKFFSEIDAPEQASALGEMVKVRVRAEAYTGAAVDGAKVAWRVKRTTRLPIWSRWCWWCPPLSENSEEIAHGELETDSDGAALISFEAKPDESVREDVEPVFDYVISTDVTDGSGETRSATRLVSVAYTSLRASLKSQDWLQAGIELPFDVRTESHDGKGRSAKGLLRIHRLKEPEVCPRPDGGGGRPQAPVQEGGDGRPSLDPARWAPQELVAEVEVETNEQGEARVEKPLEAGAYRVEFVTKDSGNREVKALLGIQVVAPEAEEFPTRVPFFTTSPAWSVESGQVASILWGSGHERARACVEWYQEGRLLKREWSREGRTQQMFSMPMDEDNRGGVTVLIRQVTMNRMHSFKRVVEVPWTDKELKPRWERMVSKLEPGAKETWTAIVEGAGGEGLAAEMVATMYDGSLDAYSVHRFSGLSGFFRREGGYYGNWKYSSSWSGLGGRSQFDVDRGFRLADPFRQFAGELDLFGGARGGYYFGLGGSRRGKGMMMESDEFALGVSRMAPQAAAMEGASLRSGDAAVTRDSLDAILNRPDRPGGGEPLGEEPVQVRKNLQETAFFYPQLTSDDKGVVRMTFTMPEALTKWRFLGMAHDGGMRSGLLEGETVTSKDLMVQPNPPRFLREGDSVWFTVKVTNQGEEPQRGTGRLRLMDAATNEDRTAALGIDAVGQDFEVPAKESRTLKWQIKVPDGEGFLRYVAVAEGNEVSDGEEGWLPVLPRRVLVTESMSLPIRDEESKDFQFEKLMNSGASDSLESRFLHVQVVSQPAWYAVMALPYLMEFPHECSEQTFNRYYANALARRIAGSDPKMKRIFEQWKAGGDSLESPLTKNSDIKGILLEETPWLAEASSESEARHRVGLLFDENHMDRELEKSLAKLRAMQGGDGMWPWFPGGRGNEFITLYVATGFARLRALDVDTDISPALQALPALDSAMTKRYERLLKDEKIDAMNLSPQVAHYLYTRSFFLKDKALTARDRVAFDYFVGQARTHWTKLGSRMSRAQLALAMHRMGDEVVPLEVTRSLREHAVIDEEQGMYWKDSEGEGWWWWQAPIETQAMMIEAFREIDGDKKAVEECQVWLLKQKQVGDWSTTKATADAVHALLMGGDDLLASTELLRVSLGGDEIEPEGVEAGTGYYQRRFAGEAVRPELGRIELRKSDPGVSWASIHWQYLEDMERLTPDEGKQLQLEKSLFVRKNSDAGPVLVPVEGPVEVGDELVTRLVLRNDRAMEFVHLKDLRGSGTEPMNVLSGYRWQDGFGYYEVTRDTASHFFIDRLPAGVHVFETSVRVQLEGRYQTGSAEIRCMYAPEFSAHSDSLEIVAE